MGLWVHFQVVTIYGQQNDSQLRNIASYLPILHSFELTTFSKHFFQQSFYCQKVVTPSPSFHTVYYHNSSFCIRVCVCVLIQKKEIKRKFSWHLDHRWAIKSDNWTSMAQDHAQIGLDGSICYLLGVYDDDENWDAFSWHIYWVFFFLQGTSWTSFFEAHDLFLQHDILCDYYCHWFLIIFFFFLVYCHVRWR